MAHRGVAQEKALRLMLRPAADHRVHQDYISDHLELTGERKEEEEEVWLFHFLNFVKYLGLKVRYNVIQ